MLSVIDLRKQQEVGAINLITTLRSIELNVTEFCNRTCSFCPRGSSMYPNGKVRMTLETAQKIAKQLIDIEYDGRIGIVGFGEPLAHPDLTSIVKILRTTNAKWIEVNTNGDFLNVKRIQDLCAAGCTHIAVSMYDHDISDIMFDMAEGIPIEIVPRHCYKEKFELKLVDRTGMLSNTYTTNTISRPCYLPFYKMMIDWNGDVLVCDNDWGRKGVVGNVGSSTIHDIWLSDELNHYRSNLSKSKRVCVPCDKCNIDGTLFGKQSFDLFQEGIV